MAFGPSLGGEFIMDGGLWGGALQAGGPEQGKGLEGSVQGGRLWGGGVGVRGAHWEDIQTTKDAECWARSTGSPQVGGSRGHDPGGLIRATASQLEGA